MHALTVVFQLSGMGSFALALHRLRERRANKPRARAHERLHAALDRIGDYWRSGNNRNEISARLEEYSLALEAKRRARGEAVGGARRARCKRTRCRASRGLRRGSARGRGARARAENLLLHVKRCWERNPRRDGPTPTWWRRPRTPPLNAAVVLRRPRSRTHGPRAVPRPAVSSCSASRTRSARDLRRARRDLRAVETVAERGVHRVRVRAEAREAVVLDPESEGRRDLEVGALPRWPRRAASEPRAGTRRTRRPHLHELPGAPPCRSARISASASSSRAAAAARASPDEERSIATRPTARARAAGSRSPTAPTTERALDRAARRGGPAGAARAARRRRAQTRRAHERVAARREREDAPTGRELGTSRRTRRPPRARAPTGRPRARARATTCAEARHRPPQVEGRVGGGAPGSTKPSPRARRRAALHHRRESQRSSARPSPAPSGLEHAANAAAASAVAETRSRRRPARLRTAHLVGDEARAPRSALGLGEGWGWARARSARLAPASASRCAAARARRRRR